MIVIGADVHKSTHPLAAVDAATGQLFERVSSPPRLCLFAVGLEGGSVNV